MKTESINLEKDIDSMSDSVNELMNLIARFENDKPSLGEINNIYFKIINIINHVRQIDDYISEKLKVVREFQEMLSEMLTSYPYKSPEPFVIQDNDFLLEDVE